MLEQAAFYLNKFRILVAGVFAVVFVVLLSALVTAIGHNSVLDSRASPSFKTADNLSANPDFITTGLASLAAKAKQDTLAAGRDIYKTCHSITGTTNHTGAAIVRGGADTADGIGRGLAFINRGFASTAMFVFHSWGSGAMFLFQAPGKIIGSISSAHFVSNILQPADTNPVPVIQTKLSAAEIASINQEMQQYTDNQQKIKALQAAQAVDNQGLDGVLVAGDPRHGGYPTAWDRAAKDSLVDSWGMFNRECVSYAAWKVYQTYGYMPFWGGEGNANEWPTDAQTAGVSIGTTPKVHSVAIWMGGYYGHAMWVEAVKGKMIYVSQYNYDMEGHYSEMWVNGSDFTYIYF